MAIANKISATAMSTNRAKVCINLLSPLPWVRTHGDLVTEMAARRKAAPQDGPSNKERTGNDKQDRASPPYRGAS